MENLKEIKDKVRYNLFCVLKEYNKLIINRTKIHPNNKQDLMGISGTIYIQLKRIDKLIEQYSNLNKK